MAGGPFEYKPTSSAGYIVEFFVPKNLSYLGAIYSSLKVELESTNSDLASINGFSIFEVSGAFKGSDKVYSEDTLVIRVFFDKAALSGNIQGFDPASLALQALEIKVKDVLLKIAKACNNDEEQIWAMRHSDVHVYKLIGERRKPAKGKKVHALPG